MLPFLYPNRRRRAGASCAEADAGGIAGIVGTIQATEILKLALGKAFAHWRLLLFKRSKEIP